MAEGYLRARYGDRYEAFSAGTVASTVSPLTVRVMAEIGIDISGQRSKDLGVFIGEEMDVVVTVCDAAAATCPMFPGAKRTIHASFPDPGRRDWHGGGAAGRLPVGPRRDHGLDRRHLRGCGATTEPPSSRKVQPHPDYPPEEGRYLRGNDFSPVAVVIILNTDEDKIPPEIEAMVRAGVESGAALSGTVQTPNIGFEKIIWNIVGNPNIRYLVLGGPESAGHATGAALKALFANGLDEKGRIIGSDAPFPTLYNVPREVVARFLDQMTLVDCQFQDIPTLRAAIRACYQETPTEFRGQLLCDPGAYPAEPIGGKLTWKVTQPWAVPKDEKEAAAKERALALIERLRLRSAQRQSEREEP